MKHAVFLPPTGELSDPSVFADIAATAEASGWDGLFLWDHVLRPSSEPGAIADPWICLTVAAVATERIRLGTMVTPVTRRRPIKLARETIGVDQVSNGRLILGLGLGVDTSGELSRFGEVVDARERGQRLDEGAELLSQLWSGERVHFQGDHFVADDVLVLPRPVQQPRVPLWFAARGGNTKPVRRAARYDGLFPVDVTADQLATMVDLVRAERGTLDGFDVAARPDGADQYEAFAEVGATWSLTGHLPGVTMADALATAAGSPAEYFGLD